VRLDGARGHEQRGSRFGIVIQANELELSTIIVAPTSTAARQASFRPAIEVVGRKTLVLCDQIRALDLVRLGELVGRVEAHEQEAIDEAIAVVLGLT